MRRSYQQGLALTAVAGMLLAGCGDDQAQEGDQASATDQQTGTEQPAAGQTEGEELDQEALDDLMGGTEAMEDPNDDVEDGVYRGNGVVLPVPEGWSLNQQAFAQGIVAAVSEDQTQQMTAQALDAEALAATGQDVGLDSIIDSIRGSIEQEPEVDEDVELAGADGAHQLTYHDMPPQQQGQPNSSATIVVAESGDGLVGQFLFSATVDSYDEDVAELLVEEAGFDPNSEPPAMPQPQQPAPQGDGTGATDGAQDGATTGTDEGTESTTTEEEPSPEG